MKFISVSVMPARGMTSAWDIIGDVLCKLRRGNLKNLHVSARTFFNGALLYLRQGCRIMSVFVLEKLHLLVEKLNETKEMIKKRFDRTIER